MLLSMVERPEPSEELRPSMVKFAGRPIALPGCVKVRPLTTVVHWTYEGRCVDSVDAERR